MMKEARRPGRRRRAAKTFPSVQADLVMVPAGREEGRAAAEPLRQLEPEHVPIERDRPFEIRHPQVDMADADGRVNGAGSGVAHGWRIVVQCLRSFLWSHSQS